MVCEEDEDEMNRVFGMELEQLLIKERITGINSSPNIPLIIYKCIEFLFPEYQNEEGLFRISGNLEDMLKYKTAIDKGGAISFENEQNCHNVSGILKLYIRELPQPLMPLDIQDELFKIVSIENDKEKLSELQKILNLLPKPNYHILKKITEMLLKLSNNSEHTKMSSENLSIVWAPNLIWNKEKEKDAQTLASFSKDSINVLNTILDNAEFLFQEVKLDLNPTPQKKKKRKSVIDYFDDFSSIAFDPDDEELSEERDQDPSALLSQMFVAPTTNSSSTKHKRKSKRHKSERPAKVTDESKRKSTSKRSIKFNPSFKFVENVEPV